MKISIKANDKQFQAAVDRMVEKQIPFATSLALNRTLSFVRDDDLKKGYQRKFAFRNKPSSSRSTRSDRPTWRIEEGRCVGGGNSGEQAKGTNRGSYWAHEGV